MKTELEQMLSDCLPGGYYCDPQKVADDMREWLAKHGVELERENTHLLVLATNAEFDRSKLECELAKVKAENARLREALRECLDGAAYTVSVDAILDPSTRHVGLERLARHRSLLPDAVDVCPDSDSALPNVQAHR